MGLLPPPMVVMLEAVPWALPPSKVHSETPVKMSPPSVSVVGGRAWRSAMVNDPALEPVTSPPIARAKAPGGPPRATATARSAESIQRRRGAFMIVLRDGEVGETGRPMIEAAGEDTRSASDDSRRLDAERRPAGAHAEQLVRR